MNKFSSMNRKDLVNHMQMMHDKYITMSYTARTEKRVNYQRVMAELNQEFQERGMQHLRIKDAVLLAEKLESNQQDTDDVWNEPSIIGQAVEISDDCRELEAIQRLTWLFQG